MSYFRGGIWELVTFFVNDSEGVTDSHYEFDLWYWPELSPQTYSGKVMDHSQETSNTAPKVEFQVSDFE